MPKFEICLPTTGKQVPAAGDWCYEGETTAACERIEPLCARDGALLQNAPGARGFALGFALCGALMVAGGLVGLWMIHPGRPVRYAT
jgi:hypothetical protein